MTYLGIELGTTTIADETWAKAIIQPRFAFGKLKLALYLPIIYKDDLLDPSTWYPPEGNDEWSFGTDQDGWDEIALDALNDLFLKIRYIQWGDNRDPFFFKFGNIDNFELGHGSIMRNYANDSNFPSERKIGLQLGVNREKGGLELMVNDAADPEVFGFRAHTRPFAPNAKLGIGLSAMTDINPDRGASALGDPIFLNLGIDLDQPIVESDRLSVILFADATSMIPYYREDPGFGSGFQLDAVWYDGKPKNWGLDAGVFGELFILDYRLELLVSNGLGRTPFYGPLYDVNSVDNVQALNLYLTDPSINANDPNRIGVKGEVGYTLDKVFYITGGYNWNWPVNPVPGEYVDDEFWMEFGLFEELLPVYGSIGLRRIGLAAPLINGDSISFFDENLVLAGALVYPLSPIMELALEVQSNVIGGKWYPTWSVLTRLN
jgi:hypothetical protein